MKYKIDRNIPLPLYYQLKQIIINQINDEEYKVDTAIPPEFELINQYKLSRTTVRQAINELVNEGYLYRKKGVGTFVSSRINQKKENEFLNQSFYKIDNIINRNGFVCRTEFLDAGITEATPEIANYLEIDVGEEIWYMDRLRYADKKAASFSRSYFKKKVVNDFLKEAETAAVHFHDYLDSKGYQIAYIREYLIPGWPDDEVKKRLELSNQYPIMIIKNVGYMENGEAVEYSISTIDAYFVSLSAFIKRE